MARLLPSDTPSIIPRSRRATIVGVPTMERPKRYLISFRDGKSLPEPAYFSGTTEIPVGTSVQVVWEQALNRWVINFTPAGEQVTVGDELLIDGRVDTGSGVASNPPAVGWPISSAFETQFPEGPEESIPPGGIGTFYTIIAWHPSGRAVLVANRDGNDFFELYEWIPGTGFGRRIATLDRFVVEPFIQSMGAVFGQYGDTTFIMPSFGSTGGARQAVFSHDGQWLAFVANAGTQGGVDAPLIIFRVSLVTGFDWQHPVYSPDLSSYGDAYSIAWAPDDSSIVVGFADKFITIGFAGGNLGSILDDITTPTNGPITNVEWHSNGFLLVGIESNLGSTLFAYKGPVASIGSPVADAADVPVDEVHGACWHPSGNYALYIEKYTGSGDHIHTLEFNPAGAGAWGSRNTVDGPRVGPDRWDGCSFNNDGSKIAAIGLVGSDPTGDLYSFAGGVSASLDTTTWTGLEPGTNASVGWRPPLAA